MSLHKHNVRRPIRAQFFTGPPSANAPIYDSGWVEPVVRARLDEYEFLTWDFNGGPDERVLESQAARYKLHSRIYADQVYYGVTHVRVMIDGTAGNNLPLQWGDPTASSESFQVSYFMVTRRFRPQVNMVHGWRMGFEDRATTQVVESGARVGRQRSKARSISFDLTFMSPAEGLQEVYGQLIETEGTLGRIFIEPVPHQPSLFHSTAFMGTLTQQGGVAMTSLDIMGTSLTLTETE